MIILLKRLVDVLYACSSKHAYKTHAFRAFGSRGFIDVIQGGLFLLRSKDAILAADVLEEDWLLVDTGKCSAINYSYAAVGVSVHWLAWGAQGIAALLLFCHFQGKAAKSNRGADTCTESPTAALLHWLSAHNFDTLLVEHVASMCDNIKWMNKPAVKP